MILTVVRSSPPHLRTLANSIRALMDRGRSESFCLSYHDGVVEISQGSLEGVDLVAVQAAVAAAPDHTLRLAAADELDDIPLMVKAAFLIVIDGVNVERVQHGRPAFTTAQFMALVRTKIDTL